jgi:hypothetical protein
VLRNNLAIITIAFLSCLSTAQTGLRPIKPPKPLYSQKRSLEDRYSSLSCGLVVIQSGLKLGTGFYVSPDGDVVTALHVIGDRTADPTTTPGAWNIQLRHPNSITIKNHKETFDVNLEGNLQADGDTWAADVTVLKTGKPTDCWFKIGDDKLAKTGEHVIGMGFPGLAFGSLSLYTGIISAKLKSSLIAGRTSSGQSLQQTNEFIRVQMPISTGISGAPVINDRDEVIAVVTQAGASFPDLDSLIEKQRMKDQAGLTDQSTEPDPLSAIAHLGEVFRDFASPGYGDSVPLSYLPARILQANRKSSLSGRQPQRPH